jgi:tRNA pseudouridine65 synthase
MTETPPPSTHPPLPILFIDEHIVAVSKPSGLLIHRDERYPDAPAVLQTVRDQTGRFLYPVHRLDRGTSGIVVFAFASDTAAKLQKCMQADTASKEYLTLARYPGSGRELGEQWVCERPLHDEKDVPRPARSQFAVEEVFPHCALVRVRIATGRYHQIRRHLDHCGRHIIGDTPHGKGRVNQLFSERHGLQRLFLHHCRLATTHPLLGTPMEFVDPLPDELAAVLDRLRASGPPPAGGGEKRMDAGCAPD